MTRRSRTSSGSRLHATLVTLMTLIPTCAGTTDPVRATAPEAGAGGITPARNHATDTAVPARQTTATSAASNLTGRSFLMGFTSWPYAATPEAVQGTYAFISTNADLIVEHLDDGVPWEESLRGTPFPRAFQEKIEGRRKHRPPGAKLLLSLTSLNMGRNGLAESAGNGRRPPLPIELRGQTFDDPQLVQAYASYCRRMVEFFQPEFLLTGIEVNELLNHQPQSWEAYRALSRQVQGALRAQFPTLPMSESVTLHQLLDRQNRGLAEYHQQVQALVEEQDFFAVSFYPLFRGMHSEKEFAVALDFLPAFSRKPIAITETGHPAEPLKVRTWNLDFPADPTEQDTFVRVLLSRAQTHRYLFVTYWTARDFDELWKTFPEAVRDLGALWRDTGLIDAAGQPRPAFETWRSWLSRPRQ